MILQHLIPPWLASLVPYQPGKPVEEVEREYGIRDSIKLASNENPLGPSPRAVEALRGAREEEEARIAALRRAREEEEAREAQGGSRPPRERPPRPLEGGDALERPYEAALPWEITSST